MISHILSWNTAIVAYVSIYAMKHSENSIVQKAAKKSKNGYIALWKWPSSEIAKLVDSV